MRRSKHERRAIRLHRRCGLCPGARDRTAHRRRHIPDADPDHRGHRRRLDHRRRCPGRRRPPPAGNDQPGPPTSTPSRPPAGRWWPAAPRPTWRQPATRRRPGSTTAATRACSGAALAGGLLAVQRQLAAVIGLAGPEVLDVGPTPGPFSAFPDPAVSHPGFARDSTSWEGWGSCRDERVTTRRSCGIARCGWSRRSGQIMPLSGLRLSPWRRILVLALLKLSTTG